MGPQRAREPQEATPLTVTSFRWALLLWLLLLLILLATRRQRWLREGECHHAQIRWQPDGAQTNGKVRGQSAWTGPWTAVTLRCSVPLRAALRWI